MLLDGFSFILFSYPPLCVSDGRDDGDQMANQLMMMKTTAAPATCSRLGVAGAAAVSARCFLRFCLCSFRPLSIDIFTQCQIEYCDSDSHSEEIIISFGS